jgi:phosphoglycerate dehydrogenase-like enzyme
MIPPSPASHLTNQTVGIIGVGLMGYGVCRGLLGNCFGVPVIAHRRSDQIEGVTL